MPFTAAPKRGGSVALAVARRQELLFAIRGFRYRRLKITKAEQGVN